MNNKYTIKQKLLQSLVKYKKGASWRRLYSWHQKLNYSSIYQVLQKIRREGLVEKKGNLFFITDLGIKELSKEVK